MKNIDGFEFLFYNELMPFEIEEYYKKSWFFVSKLKLEYPHFERWFSDLFEVAPFLKINREILLCRYQEKLVGIAILKKTIDEQKICTLRVDKKFQKLSIGKKLMELSFEWLENDKPLITVHKTKQQEFERLFRHYNFHLADEKWGYYRMFCTELSYNGDLPSKSILTNRFMTADVYEIIAKYIEKGICNSESMLYRYIEFCIKQNIDANYANLLNISQRVII